VKAEVEMQMVILAGGIGRRMQTVARDVPKALIPVAGKPFIEHQFELLSRLGIRNILLCVGFRGEQIKQYVLDGARWGFRVGYSFENPDQLLGTGGTLVHALPLLDESFLVLYGDSYLPTRYDSVARAFKEGSEEALMCVFRNEGKWHHSNVRIRGAKVVYYSKSAPPGAADCVDYGLSAYRRSVIESYRKVSPPFGLTRIQQDLVEEGRLGAFEVKERFHEIGEPEGLAELETFLAGRSCGQTEGAGV